LLELLRLTLEQALLFLALELQLELRLQLRAQQQAF